MDSQKPNYADPSNQEVKPGIYSSEFWICVGVVLLGLALQSGYLDDKDPTQHLILAAIGGLLQLAAALGFTVARAKVKIVAILGAVDIAKAKALPESSSTSKDPVEQPPTAESKES